MKTNLMKTDTQGRFLVPLQEVANSLCVERSTLYKWMKKGDFPEPIKQGRLSYYALSDLEHYLGRLKRTLNKVKPKK